MKLLTIIIQLATISIALTSCSKDYLETKPTTEVPIKKVFETTENAKYAVNGLSRLMKRQYISQGFNGEGAIKLFYGNYMGNHTSAPLDASWSSITNFDFIVNHTNTYTYYPWYYYYMIIGNANAIIENIENAIGPQKDKDFIKAQALTFRAYCYMMLVQIYGDRWADSNNGTTSAVVIRHQSGMDDLPLSTLAETYKLIYDDLDAAIALYTSSGLKRASGANYQVNLDVAHATYARAALNKEDFAKAEKYAKLARKSYPLMRNVDYLDGFANPTSEWIWSVYDSSEETIYFYSYQAMVAYNSTASAVRTAPKSISKELYSQIPATDIRKHLFLDPHISGLAFNEITGQGNASAVNYIRNLYPSIPRTAQAYAYMQFKIKANDMPGVGHTNNFRSSEMVLIEAEAKYKQGKPVNEIQALLNELNRDTGRDPSYNCSSSGDQLFSDIKKYRAIELWGEGFDWFDAKRWGDPIVRKSFKDGGNFQDIFAIEILSSEKNKWRFVIPAKETDFNKLID